MRVSSEWVTRVALFIPEIELRVWLPLQWAPVPVTLLQALGIDQAEGEGVRACWVQRIWVRGWMEGRSQLIHVFTVPEPVT